MVKVLWEQMDIIFPCDGSNRAIQMNDGAVNQPLVQDPV